MGQSYLWQITILQCKKSHKSSVHNMPHHRMTLLFSAFQTYHWFTVGESDTTERLHFHFSLSCIGEGNGNPLQCYCLENPRDGGAWWAAVFGVAQSRTRLKRLSSSSSSSSHSWKGLLATARTVLSIFVISYSFGPATTCESDTC